MNMKYEHIFHRLHQLTILPSANRQLNPNSVWWQINLFSQKNVDTYKGHMFDLNGPSAKLIELHQIRLFIRFHSDLKIRKSIVSCVRVFINDDHWRVTVRTYNVYTYVTKWLYQQMVGIWVNRTTFTTNIKRIYLLIHMAIDMFDRVQCEKMQNLNHLIQSCGIQQFAFNSRI